MRIPPQTVRQIHFVGIGGIGMSGIAELLANLGYQVTGSDLADNANTLRLRACGVTINLGHEAKNVQNAQVVVISSGIKDPHNPEISEARRLGIPVIKRAEMLAELMHLKLSVAICGTHGKTTTTSLTAAMFDAAGLDPTVVNGGIINSYGTNSRLGKGDWIIVEADESDGSFLRLPATIAVVTNVDPEHMDFYPDFEALRNSFVTFVNRVPFYGLGVLCIDHPVVRDLLPAVSNRRILTYGFSEDASIRAVNLRESQEGTLFDVDIVPSGALAHRSLAKGNVAVLPRRIKDIFLPMMGRHNVLNALSAIAIAQELGIDDSSVVRGFSTFEGVKRRFTRMGSINGIAVIDDYAHHPVEIKTVLGAARQACKGKIIAVMQPHRFSRLKHLFEDFTTCFDSADTVILTPVYSGGEDALEGFTSETLAEGLRKKIQTPVHTIGCQAELAPLLVTLAQPGDIVLCLGAGSITHWAASLPEELKEQFDLPASHEDVESVA